MDNPIAEQWAAGLLPLKIAANWTDNQILIVADLGYALAEHGMNKQSLAVFEGLLGVDQNLSWVNTALGVLWLRVEELDRGLSYHQRALENDPSDILALVNRGEALLMLKRWDLAARDLSGAIGLAHRDTGAAADALRLSTPVRHATPLLSVIHDLRGVK
ncbi:MAG TPA: hypothetical protein VK557_12850 [Pyrinomonadaceae bacterium]|nr:hypothetical protein [Pyrinomonadaceae bacterium]